MDNETFILKPSQWINVGYIVFGIIAAPLVVPILLMAYKLLEVYFWQYEFYEDHIIERKGIFSVTRREIYYHRIKGIRHDAPFLYRLVGISNIHLISSDPYIGSFQFLAIPHGLEYSQVLREFTQDQRKKNKVKELDWYRLSS